MAKPKPEDADRVKVALEYLERIYKHLKTSEGGDVLRRIGNDMGKVREVDLSKWRHGVQAPTGFKLEKLEGYIRRSRKKYGAAIEPKETR